MRNPLFGGPEVSKDFLLSRRTFLATPLVLAACQPGKGVINLTGQTMGTNYTIVVVDQNRKIEKSALQSSVDAALAQVNSELSNWDAGSEVSRLNALKTNAKTAMSPAMAAVMNGAAEVHGATDGQFDVTMGPLIELWGFGAQGKLGAVPTDAEIEATLAKIGQSNSLTIEGNMISKSNPEAQIFLSAIGKGYGVDRIADVVRAAGATDFMVEIGGDLVTSGRNPEGQHWQIGIESPNLADSGLEKVARISGMGMATSGDYRNYFEVDGQRFSHILDTKTGRPVTHKTASVSVLAENAMMADAWATAMLVLGRDRGLEIANQRDLAVLFLDRDENSNSLDFVQTPSARFEALQG